VQRRHRKHRVVEHNVELCQEGIEQVQVCTKGIMFRVRVREVSKEDTHRVVEHSGVRPV
jgi:hypothetical protein